MTPDSMLSRRGQRRIVFVMLVLVVLAFAVWPVKPPASASAAPTETFQCGAGDANRATLVTAHGNIQRRPCISGVNLNLTIPLGPWNLFCLCYERRFSVNEIRRIGQENVKMSDGSTQSLWHFSFAKFTITKAGVLKTTDGNGYTLTITPDAFAQIGGNNDAGTTMYTDFWITDGEFGIAGFCSIAVSADSSLVALIQGADLSGCQLKLNIKYLVTYNADPSATGQYPARLPNTSVVIS